MAAMRFHPSRSFSGVAASQGCADLSRVSGRSHVKLHPTNGLEWLMPILTLPDESAAVAARATQYLSFHSQYTFSLIIRIPCK